MILFGVAVVFALVVLGANKFDTNQQVIIYAVATGLSMIPASLVVVLTITMAAGTKRMVERNVIVRNLKSLEALGAVTDICSDKTGTLTQGKMVARGAWVPGLGTYTVELAAGASPFNPTKGNIKFSEKTPTQINFKSESAENGAVTSAEELLATSKNTSASRLQDFLTVASLANLATVYEKQPGEWHARGDPTEIAIQVFASRFDFNRLSFVSQDLSKPGAWSEVAEFPFDSDVKRMSVIMRNNASGENIAFTKGAVERVIGVCPRYTIGEQEIAMTDEFRAEILRNMEVFAGLGLRVLALASRVVPADVTVTEDMNRDEIEKDLVFRGLIGLYDPPRPESAAAVSECHQAGISVHMLTGDHPETAKAIAIEVGILPSRMERVSADVAKAMVMTASEFDALSDQQVDELPVLPLVIARCAPSTKVRMIEALHRRGKFCAMVSFLFSSISGFSY